MLVHALRLSGVSPQYFPCLFLDGLFLAKILRYNLGDPCFDLGLFGLEDDKVFRVVLLHKAFNQSVDLFGFDFHRACGCPESATRSRLYRRPFLFC